MIALNEIALAWKRLAAPHASHVQALGPSNGKGIYRCSIGSHWVEIAVSQAEANGSLGDLVQRTLKPAATVVLDMRDRVIL